MNSQLSFKGIYTEDAFTPNMHDEVNEPHIIITAIFNV